MLVQTITKARDAANAVEQTKKPIQDVAQIRSFSGTAIRRPQEVTAIRFSVLCSFVRN